MLFRIAMSCARTGLLTSQRTFTQSACVAARYGGQGFGRFTQQTGFNNFRTRSGPTLKERLLGPTTGKPYIYGTYALLGASVVGIGALGFYGLGLSKERSILQNSAMWPSHVRERLQSTYMYLAAGLGVTAASGVAAARNHTILRLMSQGGIMPFLITMAAIMGTGYLCRSIDYESTLAKHGSWLLHMGVMGAVLAPMCMLGGPVLMRAAWYTAGIVAGLSTTAICAPSDKFLMMGGPLAMGLGVVFMANLGAIFLPPTSALGASLTSIVMFGGLILFAGFLLYDTQRVVRKAEIHPTKEMGSYYGQHVPAFDPINAQLSIYMDVLNIFIRIAMIMGGMNGSKRK